MDFLLLPTFFCTNFISFPYKNPRLLVGGPRTLYFRRAAKLLSSFLWCALEREEESFLVEWRLFGFFFFFQSSLLRNSVWIGWLDPPRIHYSLLVTKVLHKLVEYSRIGGTSNATPPRLTIPRFRETWMTLATLRCVRVMLACV